MESYILDSNIISKYLLGEFSIEIKEKIESIFSLKTNFSIISRIELESWVTGDMLKDIAIKEIFKVSNVFDIDESIILKTIQLRRNKKSIKIPDAIIASTAIVYDFTLISFDSGFERIPELKCINPFVL